MQIALTGFVVNAFTKQGFKNKQTGEIGEPTGVVQLLVQEKDGYIIQDVKCTPRAAAQYMTMNLDPTKPAQEIKAGRLPVEMTQWEIDGRQGVSFKLIESEK